MQIPVTFTLNNKERKGYLSPVNGANGNTWHLMEDNFYIGQLLKTTRGWQFSSQKYGYDELLAEQFGKVIEGGGLVSYPLALVFKMAPAL